MTIKTGFGYTTKDKLTMDYTPMDDMSPKEASFVALVFINAMHFQDRRQDFDCSGLVKELGLERHFTERKTE